MARKGKLSVTSTAQPLSEGDTTVLPKYVLRAVGGPIFLECQGEDAVVDEGMFMDDGDVVSSIDLPRTWSEGPLSAVTAATASLYYHFT